jgi:SAM-dependent methyltransferase
MRNPAMFTLTAEIYDALYAFKDYAAEAAALREIVARENPGARTVLDAACGTGEHARFLASDFAVDGIDLEPGLLEIARAKNPAGEFHVADMRTFQLEKRYDVVLCLFGSIGYLLTGEDIVAALGRFRAHLAPGGIVLVEPWLAPEVFKPGTLHMHTVDQPELKVCRISAPHLEGNISVLHFHYLVATPEGVRRAEEVHRLALVPTEQMASYFEAAGLCCIFDPRGLSGRGLFLART